MAMEQAHTAVSDAERALQSATERLARAAHQAVDSLSDYGGKAEERIRNTAQTATDRSREYVNQLQRYVEDHPMMAIGIAAAAGFVVGMLMRSGDAGDRQSSDV